MLGLELDDARAIAVRVDDQGGVQARASVAAKGDLAAAAAAALDHVTPPGADPGALGVAATVPDAPAIAPVLAALSRRFAGPFSTSGAGSVRHGRRDCRGLGGGRTGRAGCRVLAVDDHTTGGIVRAARDDRHARARRIGGVAGSQSGGARGLQKDRVSRGRSGCRGHRAPSHLANQVGRSLAVVSDAVDGDFSAIAGQQVLDGARKGDGVSIFRHPRHRKYLGMAAANLVVVADPEMLVLGGIMATAADLLLDPLRTEITRRLPKPMMDALTIRTALLGEDAAAIGAAGWSS